MSRPGTSTSSIYLVANHKKSIVSLSSPFHSPPPSLFLHQRAPQMPECATGSCVADPYVSPPQDGSTPAKIDMTASFEAVQAA